MFQLHITVCHLNKKIYVKIVLNKKCILISLLWR
ncbi:protein of unknown function [Denitratisoma oestradiolicum]|uniref:Uncharacterized protein n=1 Tax=Denitratisoma oestradiolicum TaxID=311182 RepID=A0A6S6XU46_9PROT|nr:protein of unknown function [Denitratisoma oestradiolicum]